MINFESPVTAQHQPGLRVYPLANYENGKTMRQLFLLLVLCMDCKKSESPGSMTSYDSLIASDRPIAFWNNASGRDLTINHRDGILMNSPLAVFMPNGDQAIAFNGLDQYMEVPSDAALSVPATHVLTFEAWLRPDALDFPITEGSGYVYWLGKGEPGQHEYAARMYGQHPTGHDSNRANRISGYAFNSSGGLGAGSYYEAPANWPVKKGEWMLYEFIINTSSGAISPQYPTGYTKLLLIRENYNQLVPNTDQDALITYHIIPIAGNAPFRIGTRNLSSYFKGAIGKVAIYNYELSARQAEEHAKNMFQIK